MLTKTSCRYRSLSISLSHFLTVYQTHLSAFPFLSLPITRCNCFYLSLSLFDVSFSIGLKASSYLSFLYIYFSLYRFKADVRITPGSHVSEDAINKQLGDKERVAAATENPQLINLVNQCIYGVK